MPEAKRPIDDQSDDHEHHIPISYREYKEKLNQEENMEYDNYQDDIDSHDYIYESDFELDDEDVDKTTKSELISNDLKAKDIDLDDKDEEDMIELKDPDLDDQRNISEHHTGKCLIQTDRSSTGLNLKNCVLLDSEYSINAFCNNNLLEFGLK